MRIFHIADLHLGKIVNGFSMLDEQKFILDEIVFLVKNKAPDVVIIAGDIYDKQNPNNAAVVLFNDFLLKLLVYKLDVLIISGNHDAGLKLEFAKDFLSKQKIHIVGSFNQTIDKIELKDRYGSVNFYLMPFVRPADVRIFYPEVSSYHQALKVAIEKSDIDYNKRNVFVGHQFFAGNVEGIERSDSELISVGGIDNVAYDLLKNFDYAALGHLHKAQKLAYDYIRYSGSPLKYSESEVNHQKSLVMIDLKEKSDINISLLDLKAKTSMRQVEGFIDDILALDYDVGQTNDFVHIHLLDENEVIDAIGKLRHKYPKLMTLQFKNTSRQINEDFQTISDLSKTNPIDLFKDFFKMQNDKDMNDNQKEIVEKLMRKEEV